MKNEPNCISSSGESSIKVYTVIFSSNGVPHVLSRQKQFSKEEKQLFDLQTKPEIIGKLI